MDLKHAKEMGAVRCSAVDGRGLGWADQTAMGFGSRYYYLLCYSVWKVCIYIYGNNSGDNEKRDGNNYRYGCSDLPFMRDQGNSVGPLIVTVMRWYEA